MPGLTITDVGPSMVDHQGGWVPGVLLVGLWIHGATEAAKVGGGGVAILFCYRTLYPYLGRCKTISVTPTVAHYLDKVAGRSN